MIQTTGLIEVILFVQDMEVMVQFYRDTLGLKLTYPLNVKNYSQEHWVTFWTGACTLALHLGGQKRLGADTPKIVFGVQDIEHARSYLCQRDVEISDIRIVGAGSQVCDGFDPEGNPFSLEYQPIVTDTPTTPLQ